ncbi:MAG: NAD(P)H-hydrate dehydratase [Rhodobacteraceae bacterium]|nr:NAD(P)H-hydrate dehydratase [Paracoccaceae bacterium]
MHSSREILVFDRDSVRAVDRIAIGECGIPGIVLMENAGRNAAEVICGHLDPAGRVLVFCGTGNNGGDGFVVARLLKEWGWEVEVFLYGDPERLPPDAQVNYERWRGMGEVCLPRTDADDFRAMGYQTDLVVDAIFGTGLSRAVDEEFDRGASLWSHKLVGFGRCVSIDLPSGTCSDSGRALQDYTSRADLTVTFERPRVGHHSDQGPQMCGKLVVVPLGLRLQPLHYLMLSGALGPIEGPTDLSIVAQLIAKSSQTSSVAQRGNSGGDHKYSHGHALVLSGPSGRGGAARLASRGALRIGAGVVTVGCPLDAIPENAARLDAVMLRGVADGAARRPRCWRISGSTRCGVGPGLGLDARGREIVGVALESRGRPRPTGDVGRGVPRRSVILDADALTILSQHPDLFAALHEGCVLTPHAGEFARLFPDIAEKLSQPATKGPAYSKVDATREAAARAGCVVLYKGPDTVIADPSGRAAINSAHYDRAAPWLATAGSGDVLAGFITGLLAREFSPFDAACTGAWLHVECALSFGPGLIAEDLPEELPKVFRALGL